MSHIKTTNVLIVGAGPSGMTMALALAKFGIASVVVDRRAENLSTPRAHALNPRTLEIFSALDIDVNALKSIATPVEESCWVRFVDTLSGDEYGKLPYERMHQSDDLPTPWPLFNIAQPDVEAVMQSYIDKEELIEVIRPCQWQSCQQHPEGVESILQDQQGNELRIFSRYLIGADGAGSPVRESQGIKMEGMGIVHDFVMIQFKADLSEIVKDKPGILYWTLQNDCNGTFIAFNQRNNWVFMYPYDSSGADISYFTKEKCRDIVIKAIGQNDINVEILSNGGWGLGSQVADQYSHNNVFLVGDSAHRYPPTGGLGLNTGVGDAHNLAWKMAGVLKGWAWPGLLDSYHTERQKVAQNNADFSTENAGKLFDVFVASGALMPEGKQQSLQELQADKTRWSELQQAIQQQGDHFDGLALQIGQHYGREQAPDLRAASFQYSDVGARFPHTWLTIKDQKTSSHQLLSSTEFTVLVAKGIELPNFSVEVPYQIKVEGEDFIADKESLATMGMGDASLIIVRPDGHISARFSEQKVTSDGLQQALTKASAKFLALQ